MKEALRYLQNAKEILRKAPIEDGRYADAYRKALKKYFSIHNGKLLREFEGIYDELHIAGYYRGMLHSVEVVKAALNTAKGFKGDKIGSFEEPLMEALPFGGPRLTSCSI
jgi:hypothetical protein